MDLSPPNPKGQALSTTVDTSDNKIHRDKAPTILPPGWRHPRRGAAPAPRKKRKRAVQLHTSNEDRAAISRSKIFETGEATADEVRFVMTRASCRKLEVIYQVWKQRLAQGPLPAHCREKEDYVRFLMPDMLNEMVADFCPEVIELE